MPKPYVSIPTLDCWLAGQDDDKIWLNDNSTWEIAPEFREQVEQWVLFSPVVVRLADTSAHPYVLANKSRDQQVRASFLGMNYQVIQSSSRLTDFIAQLPAMLANVGFFVALIAVTLLLAAPALSDASVRQIAQKVFPMLLQPGSALTGQMPKSLHYSWSILLFNWLFYVFVVL
ncbi:MAG: hypothetical protein JOY79_02400, partial [Acidobacteriaceae bacterium]|nr:hypothetical protein [Acidobacteriaceae bacterium]